MATAKQIAWRKKFAQRYGRGRKAKAKAQRSRSPSREMTTTARRRSRGRRSPRRSVASTIRRRVYRRSTREFIIPAADLATGLAFGDGACGPGKRVSATIINVGAGALGVSGYSIDNGIAHATKGATQFMENPATGIINGIKGAAPVLVYRFVARKIGIPKSVRIFKGLRVQVR